jgi:hypothetical protein
MKKVVKIRLNKEQIDFLEKLAKRPVSRGEKKLSIGGVLNTMLSVARKCPLDVSGVRSESELEGRFLSAFKTPK